MNKQDILWIIRNNDFIVGQSIGDSPDYARFINDLPIVIARINLYTFGETEEQARQAIDYAIYHSIERNGLIEVGFQPHNPWTGGTFRDTSGNIDLVEVITLGTKANTILNKELDRVKAYFRELKNAGITWLYRQMWEPNHTPITGRYCWFGLDRYQYWSDNREQHVAQVIDFWKYLYNYFCEFNDNIVWCYSVSSDQKWIPLNKLYPGDQYTDLVGVTMYNDIPTFPDTTLLNLSKPVFIFEFGPYPTVDGSWNILDALAIIKNQYPQVKGGTFWHSYGNKKLALINQQQAQYFLNNVTTLNNIKRPACSNCWILDDIWQILKQVGKI